MRFKIHHFWFYIRHDILILCRYQQIYMYPLIILTLVLLPFFFSIKDRNFTLLVLWYSPIIYWLLSPFFLNMLSFSSEDTRSFFLFPLKLKNFIITRTILNLCLLIIANNLSIVLTVLLFPKMNINLTDIMILSMMHLLPAMSIGNLTSLSSLSWIGKTTFSWEGGFVLLVLNVNIIVYKISLYNFSKPVFISIILAVLLIYIGFYYLSFQKALKEIYTCFSSIAER